MTYENDYVISESNLSMGDENGDYMRLKSSNNNGIEEFGGDESQSPRNEISFWWWLKMGLLCICAIAIAIVFIIWVGPFLLNKGVIPILDWEMATFSPKELAVLLLASLILFPSLLVPCSPSMWVGGISFGYGFGFLLILPGLSVGMSLPYLIGSPFRQKIHTWLERWPKKAAIIRLAGEGNWFHQFRAVVLLRISPFPFVIFNYAAVAANIKYIPYIIGSIVGVVPDIFISIYSGILIRSLADATQGNQSLSTPQFLCNALGFFIALAATIAITIYAKRALNKLQNEEVPLLE